MTTVRSEFRIGVRDETRSGVQSVTRSLDQLKASATAAATVIGGLGAGIALGGVANSARQVVELGDKLRDLSFATGQSVEQLSFLDFAAKQSGTSIEAIAGASQRLAKNLADVSRGNGKAAATALQELGLSANELARLDLVSQIESIGQALQKIENPSQRAAAGAALFGRQFRELAPLVLDTSNGFGELAARFVELGGTLTREQADAFDALNDSMGELQLSVRQAGEALATLFAPAITGVATSVADFVNNIGPALTSRFFDIQAVLLDASRAVQRSKLDFLEFFNVFGLGDDVVASTKKRIEEITAQIALVRDAQQGVIDDRITQRQRERDAIGQALQGGDLTTTDEGVGREAEKAAKAAARVADELKRESDDVRAYLQDFARDREQMFQREVEQSRARTLSLIEQFATPQERAIAQLDEIAKLVGDNTDTYGRAAIDAFNALNPTLDETDEKAKDLERTFADLGATFSSAFEDAILGGEKFGTVLEGLLKDIGRLVLRKTVSDPLAGVIGDLFGSASGGGGGIGSTIAGFAKSLFGGFRADGGPVSSGKGYIVGERGPELFFPGMSGAISPNGGAPIVNIIGAPSVPRVTTSRANGRHMINVAFTEAAQSATAAGMLSPLGLSPPMATR